MKLHAHCNRARISMASALTIDFSQCNGQFDLSEIEVFNVINILKQITTRLENTYKSCSTISAFLETVARKTSELIDCAGLTDEIDERKYGKQKYNKGRLVEGQWRHL